MLSILLRHEFSRMLRPTGIWVKLAVCASFWFLADWVADGGIVSAFAVLVPLVYLAGLVGWVDTAETTVDGATAWSYAASRPLPQERILAARKIALNAAGALLTLAFIGCVFLSADADTLTIWGFVVAPAAWPSVLVGGLLRDEWPTGPQSE